MSIITAIAVYFIIWWVTLFAILPFGVRTQDEAGDVAPGTVSSAPHRSRIGVKLLATTVVSAIVFSVLWGLKAAGFTIDDIPFLPRF